MKFLIKLSIHIIAILSAFVAGSMCFLKAQEPSPTATIALYTQDATFARNILLERFTSERCSSCPMGERTIAQSISDPTLRGRVVLAAIHPSFGNYSDDFYTLYADYLGSIYTELTNNYGMPGYPSILGDRSNIGLPSSSGMTTSLIPASPQDLTTILQNRLASPSPIGLGLSSEISTGQIRLTATIHSAQSMQGQSLRYTAYIVKNEMQAVSPSSYTSILKNTVLGVLTPVRGEAITIDGRQMTVEKTFENLPPNLSDCQVVFFIHYNNASLKGVLNAIQAPIGQSAGLTSMQEITDIDDIQVLFDGHRFTITDEARGFVSTVYSMDGRQVTNAHLPSGSYVLRIHLRDGSIRTLKASL